MRATAPILFCAVLTNLVAPLTNGEPLNAAGVEVTALGIVGARKTRPSTFERLLPRPLPTRMTSAEVTEYERRVGNLGVFDLVKVHHAGTALEVTVREKWTITPDIALSTGQTLADTSGSLGVTEHSLLGTASALSLWVSREQRGLGAGVGYEPHGYAPGRWTLGGEVTFQTASFRFEDEDQAWKSRWLMLGGYALPPLGYGDAFRLGVGGNYFFEHVSEVVGNEAPPGGHVPALTLFLQIDRYAWDDLTPRGARLEVTASAGYLLPSRRPRHALDAELLSSLRLASTTVLIARTQAGVVPSGDPNHSLLLGTQEGVRGLPDALLRNRAQAFVNLELRSAWRFAERWALQGVAFADAALFQPMDAAGAVRPWSNAFAAGAGFRLLPTFMTAFLLRVDASRLMRPEPASLVQLGLAQYF